MKNMKVTVCFANVRVVVPCGDGELLVRDLIRESIRRYKKASGKSPDSWVVCHHLQSQSGILDPDDKLNDVADDREQIIASFDEYNGPDSGIHQGGGDGASGSSIGTESPDMFTRPDPKAYVPVPESNHIEVPATSEHNTSGLGLQVRRGSEPNLNQLTESMSQVYSSPTSKNPHADPTKRWSAAPVCRSDTEPPERLLANYHNSVVVPEEDAGCQQPQHSHNDSMNSNFSRSGRLSMQFLGGDAAGYRWMDAAERVAGSSNSQNKESYSSKSLPREAKRKEPLGQANSCYDSLRDKKGEMLLVLNEQGTALGLTAYPDPEKAGLLVEAVESGSRAEKGRLRRGDRIVEINGAMLNGLSEKSMQEQLKRCLTASELRLRVIRGSIANRRDNRISQFIDAGEGTKSVNTSPNRKITSVMAPALQVANTRKIGRKIDIALTKGPQGLGFSVTTRDNPAGGHCPIYIKNILPKGAAVEDGRLKPGDRLLEVDGVPMTGKSQTEVVAVLRSTLLGTTVKLVVSRQELVEEREVAIEREEAKDAPPKPPAPVMPKTPETDLRGFKSSSMRLKRSQESVYSGFNLEDNKSVFPWRNREILTLHIPCHDTEKAGLGVSVKGKTGSPNAGQANLKHDGDLGIFVKSVINGGAASRDGRLKMNDQLLSVNGVSLLGQSNAEAMDTLRRAMIHSNSKYPGNITLTVARRISRPASIGDPLDSENSGTSDTSGATVIYLNNSRDEDNQRWSNPVLDRLTGGTGQMKNPPARKPGIIPAAGLRNESYYMATMDNWSPAANLNNLNGSNGVLIEEDHEPTSPKLPNRIETDARKVQMSTSTPNGDVTYASQLSIESNPPIEAFSRDAVGRRSMSEKHHAALDAKETGTYQRNKKLREDREKERKINGILGGSMESLADAKRIGIHKVSGDLKAEALDKVGDLGPSLGMKKSSSLESLQTMVQEIQMSDEPRGPVCLKTPRGRGREELVRAAVEIDRPPENQPRKHWLLEDGTNDCEGGFMNRHGPFQSSLTDGKVKPRQKKSSILKGIGHMFRFGKHRKDGVAPAAVVTTTVQKEAGTPAEIINGWHPSPAEARTTQTLPTNHSQQRSLPAVVTSTPAMAAIPKEHRVLGGPPQYVNPPKPSTTLTNGVPTAIHQNDVFNHRYSHYVNYDELQHHINRFYSKSVMNLQRSPSAMFSSSPTTSPTKKLSSSLSPNGSLSESTLEQMRLQVMLQRAKVAQESRRHQIYHSTRSSREVSTPPIAHQTRPVSTFYEYESAPFQPQGSMRKVSHSPVSSLHHSQQKMSWHGTTTTHGGSIKNRGPFVTQVTIRDTANHSNQPPASKV